MSFKRNTEVAITLDRRALIFIARAIEISFVVQEVVRSAECCIVLLRSFVCLAMPTMKHIIHGSRFVDKSPRCPFELNNQGCLVVLRD